MMSTILSSDHVLQAGDGGIGTEIPPSRPLPGGAEFSLLSVIDALSIRHELNNQPGRTQTDGHASATPRAVT